MRADDALVLRRHAGTSLHRQVYLVLRERLAEERWEPGARLPNEQALCDEFGVSRITLRRAISDLESDGLVRREQGRGTFVLAAATPARALPMTGLLADLHDTSRDTRVRVLEFGYRVPSATIRHALGLGPDDEAQRSLRVRSVGRVPVLLLLAHVPADIGRRFGRDDLARRPMFEVLLDAGVRFGRQSQQTTATLADPVRAARLAVAVGAPLLRVTRVLHDEAGRAVEHVDVWASPERTRLVSEAPADLVDRMGIGRFVHLRQTHTGNGD